MGDSKALDAIRKNCLDCSCGSAKEVALCVIPGCPLFPYRFGRDKRLQESGVKMIIDAHERGEDTLVSRGFYEIKKVGKQLKIVENKKGNG